MNKKDIAVIAAGAVMAIGLGAQAVELKKFKELKESARSANEIERARRMYEKSNKRHKAVVEMAKEIYKKHGVESPVEKPIEESEATKLIGDIERKINKLKKDNEKEQTESVKK